MAIKNFKEILNKTAQRVDIKDRKIFERGMLPAYFGRGLTDTIEFILYDQGDNQLPQGEEGKKVRYINISAIDNIRKYILIARGGSSNKPSEYFVDIERLINEAGYSNGLFRTQVTLLNKRVGSEKRQNKLWVHEISPSRTEIRVLPMKVKDERLKDDLLTRYSIFLRDGEFRDDIVNRIQAFQGTLSVEEVKKVLMNAYGADWIALVKKEFRINNLDDLLKRIVEKSREAINYFISNREWKIGSKGYGDALTTSQNASLDIMQLYKISNTIVCDVIESMLPKRNIIGNTTTTPEMMESRDKVEKILQKFSSSKQLDTKASVVARVIKPRPIKRGSYKRPPKPVKVKPTPKVYFFYECKATGNQKIKSGSRKKIRGFGIRKPSSIVAKSAYFSYENMQGATIKFNLLAGTSSRICALEGTVKVSGGGTITKKELCQVKDFKPIIIKPKPPRPAPTPPPPPPIKIKIPPIFDFPKLPPIKIPPIDLGLPKIKWPLKPIGYPGPIGDGGVIPPVFKVPKYNPPKPTPVIKTPPKKKMGGGAAGMGTFGSYRKNSFGSGFNPFGSMYGG